MDRFAAIKTIVATALALTGAAPSAEAQRLRNAITDADVVVVGRHEGVRPFRNWLLHRIRIVDALGSTRVAAEEIVTVVEARKVADRPRPAPEPTTRLFCLDAFEADGLPQAQEPFFTLTGWAGESPRVDPAKPAESDPVVRFATTLLAAERGASSQQTTAALLRLALDSAVTPVRTEAVEVLRHRDWLHARIPGIDRSRALARATAETDDLGYKIALGSLCVEMRVDGAVDALCMSAGDVADLRYAKTLGRLARFAHGEDAIVVLTPHLQRARTAAARERLLVAIGATKTKAGLRTILRYRDNGGATVAVRSALDAHGSRAAREAIAELDRSK